MWQEIERLARERGPDDPAHDALPGGGRPARRAARDRRSRRGRRRGHARGAQGRAARRRGPRRARRRRPATARAPALAGVAGVREVVVDGRTLRARADDGARAVPAVLAALEAQRRAAWRRSPSRARRSTTSTCATPAAVRGGRRGGDPMTTLPTRALHDRAPPARLCASLVDRRHARAAGDLAAAVRRAVQERDVEIPGFGADDYIDFLTPGIVVMTALFSAGWSGMAMIEDIDRGIMDRFLVRRSPRLADRRGGSLHRRRHRSSIQSLIIVGLALAAGARFPGGVPACVVLIASRRCSASAFGALSNGARARRAPGGDADRGRQRSSLLPLTFLSTAFMQPDLGAAAGSERRPTSTRSTGRSRPGARRGRADPDWGLVLRGSACSRCSRSVWRSRRGRSARISGRCKRPVRTRVRALKAAAHKRTIAACIASGDSSRRCLSSSRVVDPQPCTRIRPSRRAASSPTTSSRA